jgi:hypothetical protein
MSLFKATRVYRAVQLNERHWTLELSWKRFWGLHQSDWRPTHELCYSEYDALARAMDYIALWGGEISY